MQLYLNRVVHSFSNVAGIQRGPVKRFVRFGAQPILPEKRTVPRKCETYVCLSSFTHIITKLKK